MTGIRAFVLCTVCTCLVSCGAQNAPAAAPVASSASAPAPGGSQVETRPLDPFSRVALCAPFTVLVAPSSAYQLTIDAEDAVRSSITTLVDGSTLLLESTSFTATKPIKITVGLPAAQLSAVTARGTFPAIVAPGFKSSRLSLNAQGTSQLSVLGVSTAALDLSLTGTGTTVITGNITSASIRSSGTGDVYVSGVNTSVVVKSTGTGSIYVASASGSVAITGDATGLGRVYYNQGTCQVTSNAPDWVFGPKCQQSQVQPPDTSASWTCGIQVVGRNACTGGSASVRTTNNCQASPMNVPTDGSVSAYSLVNSKAGTVLGLDTNTTPQAPATAGATAGGVTATPVNGVANGANNTAAGSSTNGQGNGVNSTGAGNGNNNGNSNVGGFNGNNNGVGNVGNGNGSGNGNGNTNSG